VSVGLNEERDALQAKVRALQQEAAATQADLSKAKGTIEEARASEARLTEQLNGQTSKATQAKYLTQQLEKDLEKLRARLASKEEIAKTATSDSASMQAKVDELVSEAGRRERALTMARTQALEEKQKCVELEQVGSQLEEAKVALEAKLERRAVESQALLERATRAEAESKMLRTKLDQMGASSAEASLQMRSLEDVQKQAGVFDPLGQLPNVPVLHSLVDTIDRATSDLGKLTSAGGALSQMADVHVLQVDQTLPKDELEAGGVISMRREEVPLPYPPVLMRQFTPPPENLPPPSPPPPEPEDPPPPLGDSISRPAPTSGERVAPSGSGAGQIVLPGVGSSREQAAQS
jgi:myosin heavy subunit